jgi:predicted flavoprotein YhiN
VPRALADVIMAAHPALGERTIGALTRDERRHLLHTLLEWPLPIAGSRGFTHAEVTAGGVALAEISPRTMESRVQPGLFFVGEVLDVDGRLGGFNFQWSWASAKAAAEGVARKQGR